MSIRSLSYIEQACIKGNFKRVKSLVENKASVDGNCVSLASQNGHRNIVRYLIDNKADIHSGNDLCISSASEHGNINLVKYLVEQKADIRVNNNLSLILACINGHLEMVKYLVENKADVHARQEQPIRLACTNNLNIVSYLVANGADISNISDKYKNIFIYGPKILKFWRNQNMRRRLIRIRNILIPIYYAPDMKGGYFAKKNLEEYIGGL